MQYISRYHLKPLKAAQFQQWLLDNENLLAEHAGEGWTYVGTWFTVMGFGKYECETRWEVEDYGMLGTGWGDETFQRLMREWMEFTDQSRDGENYLMKSTTDVNIFE